MQRVAWRKLAMLDAAETLAELRHRLATDWRSCGGPGTAVQHQDQPAVADLLLVVRRRALVVTLIIAK